MKIEIFNTLTQTTWRNNKTQNLYRVINLVTDATNSREGQLVVIYIDIKTGSGWCRELGEFLLKFTPELL